MNVPISIRRATEKDARRISRLIRRNAEMVLAVHYSRDQLMTWKRYNTPARIRQRLPQRTTFFAPTEQDDSARPSDWRGRSWSAFM
ncbi:MAG: hypothetical protein AABP62_00785 [Planctomycetota bacterium]